MYTSWDVIVRIPDVNDQSVVSVGRTGTYTAVLWCLAEDCIVWHSPEDKHPCNLLLILSIC